MNFQEWIFFYFHQYCPSNKGGFFSESAMKFLQISKSQKRIALSEKKTPLGKAMHSQRDLTPWGLTLGESVI